MITRDDLIIHRIRLEELRKHKFKNRKLIKEEQRKFDALCIGYLAQIVKEMS
ncbi:MAG: hypothetical protein IKG42_04995 [Clostridia bacterium]|nr:hypothetical protein [Clostridia bacterium]